MNRRQFVAGLFVAPAIVRAGSLMPIKPWPHVITLDEYIERIMLPMARKYEHTILFGNPDAMPMLFNGLILPYNGDMA